MASKLTLSYKDWEGEGSRVQFTGINMTAGNFTAEDAKMEALRTAVEALSIGSLNQDTRVYEEDRVSVDKASSPNAQREAKWLIRYHDANTNENYTLEIPCFDATLLDTEARDGSIDKTNAAWTDFKAAFDAFHRSPNDNASVADDAVHVGRNL